MLQLVSTAGEHANRRMALQGLGEHLCALDTQADTVVLNCGNRRLRNTGALGELVFWLKPCSSRMMRTDSPTDTLIRFFAARN